MRSIKCIPDVGEGADACEHATFFLSVPDQTDINISRPVGDALTLAFLPDDNHVHDTLDSANAAGWNHAREQVSFCRLV
jgi:hypothetical protein